MAVCFVGVVNFVEFHWRCDFGASFCFVAVLRLLCRLRWISLVLLALLTLLTSLDFICVVDFGASFCFAALFRLLCWASLAFVCFVLFRWPSLAPLLPRLCRIS